MTEQVHASSIGERYEDFLLNDFIPTEYRPVYAMARPACIASEGFTWMLWRGLHPNQESRLYHLPIETQEALPEDAMARPASSVPAGAERMRWLALHPAPDLQ